MVASEPIIQTPRCGMTEKDEERTPGYGARKDVDTGKTPLAPKAPQKNPTTRRFDSGHIPEITKFKG